MVDTRHCWRRQDRRLIRSVPNPTRRLILVFGVVGLALGGCGLASNSATTLAPKSDFGWVSYRIFSQILWWDVGIFLVVALGLLWVIVRFRERDPRHVPVQVRGNARLELAWTIGPAIALAFIAFPTVAAIFRTQEAPPPGALKVHVIGHQWWWEFRYPEIGITTASEIHLPVGRTVAFDLESPDVIHSFWVPELGGKRDVLPGQINHLLMTPTTPGQYHGQCAEFCGTSHANMRLTAIVDSPADFEAWVARQKAPAAQPPDGTPAAKGLQVFSTNACVGCHTIQGVSGGVVGPNLTHVGSRTTLAGGMLANTPENLTRWLKDPPGVKPGSIMPNLHLTDDQVQALIAYLESLT